MSSRRSRSAGIDSKSKESSSKSTKRKDSDDTEVSSIQSNEDKKKATRANGGSHEYSDVNGSSSTRSKKKLNGDMGEAGPSGANKNKADNDDSGTSSKEDQKESEVNNEHELSNGGENEELKVNEPAQRNRDNKKKRKANDNEDDDEKKKEDDDDETSENENFEVSKIIDVKTVRNKRSFLVRWKGYGSDDDTWEPEDNLNCPELLENFLSKVDEAKEVPEKQPKRKRPQTNRYIAHENAKRSSKRTSGQKKNYSED